MMICRTEKRVFTALRYSF